MLRLPNSGRSMLHSLWYLVNSSAKTKISLQNFWNPLDIDSSLLLYCLGSYPLKGPEKDNAEDCTASAEFGLNVLIAELSSWLIQQFTLRLQFIRILWVVFQLHFLITFLYNPLPQFSPLKNGHVTTFSTRQGETSFVNVCKAICNDWFVAVLSTMHY